MDFYSSYFAYACDKNVRFLASSGGFCKSFLCYLIDSKIVDGVIISRSKDMIMETIVTDNKDEILSPNTNSIYAPVDVLKALSAIDSGKKYAIVGLGCHIKRLRKMQANGYYKNVIIAIGLICNLTPKIDFLQNIIEDAGENLDSVKNIFFRGQGWPGKITIVTKEGRIKHMDYKSCWRKHVIRSESFIGLDRCKYCKSISEYADIICSDPWNIGMEEHDSLGKTLISCTTEFSDVLVRGSSQKSYVHLEDCDKKLCLKSRGPTTKEKSERKDNRILLYYYNCGNNELNFGEHIPECLIREFGYHPVSYSDKIATSFDNCLFTVGSVLDKTKLLNYIKTREIWIWGHGKGRAGRKWDLDINDEKFSHVRIFALRGPNTARQIRLNKFIPMGDPGFLLPIFFPINVKKDNYVLYQPHHVCCENICKNTKLIEGELKRIKADIFSEVVMHRDFFWNTVKKIVAAKFVLTSSLHTAIIAHAYGTPWALCLGQGEILNMPEKWRDIYEFLGIWDQGKGLVKVNNFEEGLQWWNTIGSNAKIPDLSPLIEAFPYPIQNTSAIKAIALYKKEIH